MREREAMRARGEASRAGHSLLDKPTPLIQMSLQCRGPQLGGWPILPSPGVSWKLQGFLKGTGFANELS